MTNETLAIQLVRLTNTNSILYCTTKSVYNSTRNWNTPQYHPLFLVALITKPLQEVYVQCVHPIFNSALPNNLRNKTVNPIKDNFIFLLSNIIIYSTFFYQLMFYKFSLSVTIFFENPGS